MRKTILALVALLGLSMFAGNTADAAKKAKSCVCQVGGDFSGNLNCTVTGSLSNGKFRCHVSKGGGDGEDGGKGKCKDDEDCKGGEKDDDDDAEKSGDGVFQPGQYDPLD